MLFAARSRSMIAVFRCHKINKKKILIERVFPDIFVWWNPHERKKKTASAWYFPNVVLPVKRALRNNYTRLIEKLIRSRRTKGKSSKKLLRYNLTTFCSSDACSPQRICISRAKKISRLWKQPCREWAIKKCEGFLFSFFGRSFHFQCIEKVNKG